MSIGRAQGHHMLSTKESLPAHPLLSPSPSSSITPTVSATTASSASPSSSPSGTKYVPYTPRQRVPGSTPSASAPTSTNATASPTSSGAAAGGATRELQRQNMKAEIQGLGLGSESGGWMMLDKLSSLGSADEEWEEIWGMITVGKATLLLPKEPLTHAEVTPELVRDHVVFITGTAGPTLSPLVTLPGLRGVVESDVITFRSTLATDSTQFTNLISATSRGPTLQSLPPLPVPLSHASSPPYPAVSILSAPAAIPLPPRPSPVPPPLPSRPKPAQSSGRLSGLPFVSLFGSKTAPPTAPATAAHTPVAPAPSTPTGEGPTIEVWPIDRVLHTKEIGREISKAMKGEVKAALAGLPSWLTDRVTNFIAPFLPASKAPKATKLRSNKEALPLSPSPDQLPTPDTFQAFYSALYGDLQLHYEHSYSPLQGRKGSKDMEREKEKEPELDEKEASLQGEVEREKKVREAIDKVEGVLCCLLYDRVFRPMDSDDDRHDEALASRIAALNMLDLGLEHLGVDVIGDGDQESVIEVVRACGRELEKLQSFQSPKDKSAILVSAHKIVADGLGHLPPLRLRPEGEVEERTPRPAVLSAELDGQETAKPSVVNGNAPEAVEMGQVNGSATGEHDEKTGFEDGEDEHGQEILIRPTSLPVPPMRFPGDVSQEASTSTSEHPKPPPLPPRPSTPPHLPARHSPSPQPTPSADLMLPLIIFAVVKSNPAQLVSNLLYVQRYRDTTVGGEEGYCLINLSAVVEFLEHVDLGVLGLGGEERVLSIEDLTPIPLVRSPSRAAEEEHNVGGRLRGTVNQVGELAASTNKVISGVVDSSFSALRGLLVAQTPSNEPTSPESAAGDISKIAPWNQSRPGFGLLRRASGFSIASMAASLPGNVVGHGRARSTHGREEEDDDARPMIEVNSRAGSIREEVETEGDDSDEEDDEEDGTSGQTEDDDDDEEIEREREEMGYRSDVRSVRSFSSMMSRESRERDERRERMSISDRLASMAAGRFNKPPSAGPSTEGGKRLSPPRSRRTSLLSPIVPVGHSLARAPSESPSPSPREQSPARPPAIQRIAPPSERFMNVSPDDLKLSEIGELLRDYRRVVGALKAAGGFEDG